MQQENDCDINRCPRQIEDGVDTHAGDELSEGIEITQQLAATAAESRRTLEDRGHDATGQ